MVHTPPQPPIQSRSDHPRTPQDRARHAVSRLSGFLGGSLHRIGVHPDWVTWTSLAAAGVAALFVVRGQLILAGWWLFFSGFLDVMDGAVARARRTQNPFGSLLDATVDRYADGFIFASLGYTFAQQDRLDFMLLSLVALAGSYAVSYVRARAASPDVNVLVRVGWFTRLERVVLVILALWFHEWLLIPALWLLAVGTNLTAMQRLWYVHQDLNTQETERDH